MTELLKDVRVTVQRITENGRESWMATSETLPGLVVSGDTCEELYANLQGNIPLLVDEMGLLTCNSGLVIHVSMEDQFKIAA